MLGVWYPEQRPALNTVRGLVELAKMALGLAEEAMNLNIRRRGEERLPPETTKRSAAVQVADQMTTRRTFSIYTNQRLPYPRNLGLFATFPFTQSQTWQVTASRRDGLV